MGVAGCGKSTVGAALAAELGAIYLDGDDLHSAANVTKMSAGKPLSDVDRAPWLRRIGQTMAASDGMLIVGCSALRRIYRDWIREQAKRDVVFLHLSGSRAVIERRMSAREGHFMPWAIMAPAMLSAINVAGIPSWINSHAVRRAP